MKYSDYNESMIEKGVPIPPKGRGRPHGPKPGKTRCVHVIHKMIAGDSLAGTKSRIYSLAKLARYYGIEMTTRFCGYDEKGRAIYRVWRV